VHGALKVAHEPVRAAPLRHGLERVPAHRREAAHLGHHGRDRVPPAEVLVVAPNEVEGGDRGVAGDPSVLWPEVGPVVGLAGVGEDHPPVDDVGKGLVLEGGEHDGALARADEGHAEAPHAQREEAQHVGELGLPQRDDVAVHAVEVLGVAHERVGLAGVDHLPRAGRIVRVQRGLAPVVRRRAVQEHARLGLPRTEGAPLHRRAHHHVRREDHVAHACHHPEVAEGVSHDPGRPAEVDDIALGGDVLEGGLKELHSSKIHLLRCFLTATHAAAPVAKELLHCHHTARESLQLLRRELDQVHQQLYQLSLP